MLVLVAHGNMDNRAGLGHVHTDGLMTCASVESGCGPMRRLRP